MGSDSFPAGPLNVMNLGKFSSYLAMNPPLWHVTTPKTGQKRPPKIIKPGAGILVTLKPNKKAQLVFIRLLW